MYSDCVSYRKESCYRVARRYSCPGPTRTTRFCVALLAESLAAQRAMRVEVDPTGTIAGSSRSRAGPRVDVLDVAA